MEDRPDSGARLGLSPAARVRSSFSGANGGNRVEAAKLKDIAVRDSKSPKAPDSSAKTGGVGAAEVAPQPPSAARLTSLTTTLLEVGVLEVSATESSGTSTLVSGK
ncbi:DUF397 domain-containing protein [Streptosporangium oxazolinicum]|uniref:DUF397 domain-containing protein n=1 Tax=Streptosporangium oxazolinicum TaxID=909287 RepID=UPI0031E82612